MKQTKLLRNFRSPDRYDICAGLIIGAAVALRLILLVMGWPPTDSDEATMGLMALHIAYQGAHPLLFYGQNYLGTLEAYLGAGFFFLSGPSTFSLRLGVLLLFALFLAGMYPLISQLYSKPLALFGLILLGTGTGDIIFRQLEAVGGSPDVLLFSVALLLLTFRLASTMSETLLVNGQKGWKLFFSAPSSRQRPFLYAAWGCLVGVGIWSDPLILPFVGVTVLLLFFFCRRELHGITLLLVLAGIALGFSPQIAGVLTAPLTPTMLRLFSSSMPLVPSEATHLSGPATALTVANLAAPFAEVARQVGGSLLVSVPITLSASTFCTLSSNQAWPLSGDPLVVTCTVVHGIWGVGYVALWLWAALLCVCELWHYRQEGFPLAHRKAALCQAARLMLLGGAGGTLFIYTLFPQAALTPWASSRYLAGLLISLPAVLYPVCRALSRKAGAPLPQQITWAGKYALLLVVSVACILGSVTALATAPQNIERNSLQATLMQYLLQHHETRIYTDYWTCDMLAFRSDEKIVCSVLGDNLQTGLNRYPAYQPLVSAAPMPAYVFPRGSPQAQKWQAFCHACQVTLYDNYEIYQPLQPARFP